MPAIGDLFKCRPQDVQETVNSVFYMLKQRIQDLELRNDFRQKTQRIEQQAQDANTQLSRAKEKNEQLAKEVANLKDKLKSQETKHKQEVEKMKAEREDLIKQMTKIEHKETQYKHEIRSKELQVAKLNE